MLFAPRRNPEIKQTFVFLVAIRNILYLDNNTEGTHCYVSMQILTHWLYFIDSYKYINNMNRTEFFVYFLFIYLFFFFFWNSMTEVITRTRYHVTIICTLHIHSFSSPSYDTSKASSKASSPHSAIQSFLLQMRVSSPFLNTFRTGLFKLFKRPLPGFLTILTL